MPSAARAGRGLVSDRCDAAPRRILARAKLGIRGGLHSFTQTRSPTSTPSCVTGSNALERVFKLHAEIEPFEQDEGLLQRMKKLSGLA